MKFLFSNCTILIGIVPILFSCVQFGFMKHNEHDNNIWDKSFQITHVLQQFALFRNLIIFH